MDPKTPEPGELAAAHCRGLLSGLQIAGCGGVLVGHTGRVIEVNDMARRHVGAGIHAANGHIAAQHKDANADLQRAIAGAVGTSADAGPRRRDCAVLLRPNGHPLLVAVIPISDPSYGPAGAVLVIVDPDDRTEPAESVLQRAFGLTTAEARIALGLARGLSPRAIADAQGTSFQTVRDQLKTIFLKTATHRQAELAVLLTRLAHGAIRERGW